MANDENLKKGELTQFRSGEEAARGSRTVSESDTAMQGIRSMDPIALERLIERFVRSGHPGGYRKV